MKVYVKQILGGEFMVIKDGHRRGFTYSTKGGASQAARRVVGREGGGRVLWLNDTGKVEHVDRVDGTL